MSLSFERINIINVRFFLPFSLQDSSISTSIPVIDLIDAIKPGAIQYDLVNTGTSEEVRVL